MLALPSCHYCGCRVYAHGSAEVIANRERLKTRDHVFPKVVVPRTLREKNRIVVACKHCNEVRGDAPYEVFHAYMALCSQEDRRRTSRGFRQFRYLLELAGLAAVERDLRGRS